MARIKPARRAGERKKVVVLDPADSRDVAKALDVILSELTERADGLAERMLARYRMQIPAYQTMPDGTLRQVRELNQKNINGFIKAMRDGRGPSRVEIEHIRESATKRAREGIALSALLSAYRLGAQHAWIEIRAIVGEREPAYLVAGLELATAVMAWVDEVSSAVAQAYLEEYERISSDRETARRDFVEAVIAGGLTADEVRARAEALGMDPDLPAAVAIIAAVDESDDPPAARAVLHRIRPRLHELATLGRCIEAVRGSEIVVLFHGDHATAESLAVDLRSALRASADASVFAGVGRPRESLADLAGSYREATLALTAARAGANAPVAMYGEVLVEELILRERAVSRRLAQAILDPLAPYPDLKATLIEYINHGPSLPTVARRLFLHPNTVAYRLARIRDLTGRDPKSPAGVSELFLALHAAQLVGDDPT